MNDRKFSAREYKRERGTTSSKSEGNSSASGDSSTGSASQSKWLKFVGVSNIGRFRLQISVGYGIVGSCNYRIGDDVGTKGQALFAKFQGFNLSCVLGL